jgi:hypothetical protein
VLGPSKRLVSFQCELVVVPHDTPWQPESDIHVIRIASLKFMSKSNEIESK